MVGNRRRIICRWLLLIGAIAVIWLFSALLRSGSAGAETPASTQAIGPHPIPTNAIRLLINGPGGVIDSVQSVMDPTTALVTTIVHPFGPIVSTGVNSTQSLIEGTGSGDGRSSPPVPIQGPIAALVAAGLAPITPLVPSALAVAEPTGVGLRDLARGLTSESAQRSSEPLGGQPPGSVPGPDRTPPLAVTGTAPAPSAPPPIPAPSLPTTGTAGTAGGGAAAQTDRELPNAGTSGTPFATRAPPRAELIHARSGADDPGFSPD